MIEKRLSNLDEIIIALGGTAKTARLVQLSMSAVCDWRTNSTGKIPAEHYCVMIDKLREKGFYAPRHLWNFRGISEEAA